MPKNQRRLKNKSKNQKSEDHSPVRQNFGQNEKPGTNELQMVIQNYDVFGSLLKLVGPVSQTMLRITCKTTWRAVNVFLKENDLPALWGPELCEKIAEMGSLELIEWARNNKCDWDERTCAAAAAANRKEVLKYVRSLGCPWDVFTARKASSNGNLSMLRFIHKKNGPIDSTVATAAVAGDHRHVLNWLKIGKVCKFSGNFLRHCAKLGNRNAAKWYIDNVDWYQGPASGAYAIAARNGDFNFLKLIRNYAYWFDGGELAEAIRGGDSNCIYFFLEDRKYHPNQEDIRAAAEVGDMNLVDLIIGKGATLDKHFCAGAAFGGHMNLLLWAKEKKILMDESTCAGAGEGGQLEVLKWLRSEGIPWKITTTFGIVRSGNVELLDWAIQEGCPINLSPILLRKVAEEGHAEILTYLCQKFPEKFTDLGDMYRPAAGKGNIEILEFLKKKKVEWPRNALGVATNQEQLEVCDWFSKNRRLEANKKH